MADDFGASILTTGRVTPGGSTNGRLEVVDDTDWFSINLVAGKSYSFTLESATKDGLFDPYLKLYGSDGKTLIDESDDANGLDSQIDIVISASGTYYLEASSGTSGSGIGNYVVSASLPITDDYTATIDTVGKVTPGSSVTGKLEISGDSDWFAVTLIAGRLYSFMLDSGATDGVDDPFLSLYSSVGTLIISNDDSDELNSEIAYTAPASGTYYLGASSGVNGNGIGSYKLTASQPITDDYPATIKTTGKLLAGGSINGLLESVGDQDWFSISLSAGQQYTFAVESAATNGLEDPLLSLYDSNGTLIASNDDSNGLNPELVHTATTTGTYYLGASASPHGTGTGKGSYTVLASFASSAGVTNVNGTAGNDVLTAGVGDYSFDGGAGTDTVVLPGNIASYSVQQTTSGYSINDGAGSTIDLSAIERVQFADRKLAFDMTGSAGNAAKIIGASLGTEFLKSGYDSLKGAAIGIFDSGTTMKQLAATLVNLDVFIQLEGTKSNTDFVKYIYRTVTGQVASAEDVTALAKYLNDGMTQGDFLATVADLGLNVDLVGLAKTGIQFV